MIDRRPSAVKKRADLTDYLWHFTRADTNPRKTLRDILESQSLRGSLCNPGPHRVICLTETPLSQSLKQAMVLQEEGYPRLSNYGIGFRKSWIFAQNGLPVIYQPREQYNYLNAKHRFRHVDLNLKIGIDYTWQREWRVEGALLKFDQKDVIVVVPEMQEFEDVLWEHDADAENEDGEIVFTHCISPKWDFISIDEVDNIDELNDNYYVFSPDS